MYWRLASGCLISAVVLLHGAVGVALGQHAAESALENRPVPESRPQGAAQNGQAKASQQEAETDRLAPALKAIESAIRDLIAEEDAIERDRQERREIADLQAQQDMAMWAERMFWASAFTVGLTFVGVILIYRTLVHTRKAAEAAVAATNEAKKSTVAAAQAADAAIKANQLQRQTLIVWVKNDRQLGELRVEILAQNIGNTPALGVEVYAGLRGVQTWFDNKDAILRGAAEQAQAMHVTAYTDTIYPGDPMPPKTWICRLPDEDLIRKGDDTTNPNWFEHKLIRPLLIICVDYALSFVEQRHQTWEVYSISRKTIGKKSGARAMIPIDGEIPVDELEMSRIPVGGTFAN